MGWRPSGCQGVFRTRLGYRLPGVWTEPPWLRSELRFRPCSVVLNIAAREGSFRLQPPPPAPSAGKLMPAPLGPAAVPADLPRQAAEQNGGAGLHPSPGALSLIPHPASSEPPACFPRHREPPAPPTPARGPCEAVGNAYGSARKDGGALEVGTREAAKEGGRVGWF